MTNCTPATFTWFYGATTDSQPVDLTFTITSDVPGDSHLDQLITLEALDPKARSFTWPSVNTIPGGYQIAAISNSAGFLVLSNSFQVANGACRSTSGSGANSAVHITTKSSSSAGSSASGSASPKPIFIFSPISEMTTCTPATITWTFGTATNSLPTDLTLTLTSAVRGDTDLDTLITPKSLDPLARSYTWSAVIATPGEYQISARSDLVQWVILSDSFNIVNGTETSCPSTSASSVSSAISASHPASSSSSSSSGPSVPSGASQSQGQTQGQPQASGSKVNRGAIAGGVVGGLIILVAAISVIRCQYRTRTTTPAEISPFTVTPPASMLSRDHGYRGSHGQSVLALDRPIAPDVVASQAEVFEKFPRKMRRIFDQQAAVDARDRPQNGEEQAAHVSEESASERSERSERSSQQQLRAMAERLALMEVHLRPRLPSEERPPDYTLGPAHA
ncbi:hypothetical protein DFH09DRAFT_1332900 [Mycena vulgaris]|nr:hypothetical protein DFH09DRAFT_1332900 [Mycena vulgaris]